MKGFIITALTDVGTVALDRCIQENVRELCKRSMLEIMKFHKVWIRKTSRNPLTDSWMINPDAVRLVNIDLDACVSEVHVAMIKNGCKRDVDYIVEVSNE